MIPTCHLPHPPACQDRAQGLQAELDALTALIAAPPPLPLFTYATTDDAITVTGEHCPPGVQLALHGNGSVATDTPLQCHSVIKMHDGRFARTFAHVPPGVYRVTVMVQGVVVDRATVLLGRPPLFDVVVQDRLVVVRTPRYATDHHLVVRRDILEWVVPLPPGTVRVGWAAPEPGEYVVELYGGAARCPGAPVLLRKRTCV